MQLKNAWNPIVFNASPVETDVIPVQFSKAQDAISLTGNPPISVGISTLPTAEGLHPVITMVLSCFCL